MKVLLVGYGQVGKHIKAEIDCHKQIDFQIYDKYKDGYNDESLFDKHYDVAFVAVPTEKLKDGHCDISNINDVIPKIKATAIVIKSAIPVGTCDKMADNILVSPEYYGTTQHSLDYPNFLILGGDKNVAQKVVELYSLVKDGSYHFMFVGRRTAELCKYMENCWIATKVTFCNEFAKIANHFDVPYGELREAWLCDERVSPSHTYVYPDSPYYDSHCLNKDIPALIENCKDHGFNARFMESVDKENAVRKELWNKKH